MAQQAGRVLWSWSRFNIITCHCYAPSGIAALATPSCSGSGSGLGARRRSGSGSGSAVPEHIFFCRIERHPKSSRQAGRTGQRRMYSDHAQDASDMTPQEMASLQKDLFREASCLTRTLYRKCLQSVRLIAKGNARDEDDFAAREARELDPLSGGDDVSERISMAPPVNRRNELASRANYYNAFARESFDGHWSLLGPHGFHIGDEGNMTHGLGGSTPTGGDGPWNQYRGGHHHLGGQMPAQSHRAGSGGDSGDGGNDGAKGDAKYYMWREDQVEQFVYLIRSGEEKRQWVLSDYEFEDPCITPNRGNSRKDEHQIWPQQLEDRLKNFEAKSNELVKKMYKREGWLHSSDHGHLAQDDGFFSDSDSEDDQ
ncbi:hypothetical protein ACHAWF_010893 [Thalassiosira exigua]